MSVFAFGSDSNKTYKIKNEQIKGFVNDIDSVKQSIEHILSTERYSNPIYSDDYGVELEQFIGKGYAYMEACIEKVISEALLQDNRITGVTIDDINQNSIDSCNILISVETIFGVITEELNVVY